MRARNQKNKKADVKYEVCIVGGAGHVGLPLAVLFANKGLKTVILDIHRENMAKVRAGRMPFKEEGGSPLLRKALRSRMLSVTDAPSVISGSEFVILVVGTPVDEYLDPDLTIIMKVMGGYFPYFRDGQVLILRSTVYPGTSEYLRDFFASKKRKVDIAFCPERTVQGYSFKELVKLPQIISAFNAETSGRVRALFSKISPKIIHLENPAEAELAKLFTNAWRYIKFAVANQFFMIAEGRYLDYHHIDKAIREDYPRNADLPRPGFAAGPCLFKDTMQLAAFNNNNFQLGHSAMLVNEGLPGFIIRQIKDQIERQPPLGPTKAVMRTSTRNLVFARPAGAAKLRDKTIGILGMAFKAESDDPRDSLSFKLRKIGLTEAKHVLCHDPYIKDERFVSLSKLIRESDIIILGAPHAKYASVNPADHPEKVFFDIWDFWPSRHDKPKVA
jgi:UDP-N-acetyl-D-mannosaminuronic acid dehydrogenase